MDSRRRLQRPNPVSMPGQPNPNANMLDVPTNIGPAPFKPSQPRGADPKRRIILPGCDFPPADAIPVDTIQEADIGPGAIAVMITITVPDTMTLRVAGIGFGAEDESALLFISWSLFSTPPAGTITPYVNMPASIGTIPQLSWVFVVLGSSVKLELRVTNNNAVGQTFHYVARIQGWFYAEREVVNA